MDAPRRACQQNYEIVELSILFAEKSSIQKMRLFTFIGNKVGLIIEICLFIINIIFWPKMILNLHSDKLGNNALSDIFDKFNVFVKCVFSNEGRKNVFSL